MKGGRTVEIHTPDNANSTPNTTPIPIPRNGLRGFSGILLFFMLTLALTTVGIGLSGAQMLSPTTRIIAEVISGASLVLLFLYTWRVASRAKGILPVLLIVALLTAYLSNSFVPAATLFALVCAITIGALALSIITQKQAAWIPLVPILAYVATLLVCRDAVAAAACLLPVPAALALSVGTRHSIEKKDGPTRVGVICLTSFALTLSVAGFAAVALYRALGSLDPTTLSTALDGLRESVIVWITSMELPADISEEMRALFSRESAEYMVNGTINLLPGYIIAAINLLAAVSQLILHAALVSFGCGASLSDRARVFRMSAVSCVVFTAAYLLALIGNGESSTLWGTVANNVYIILLPGLAFAGMLRFVAGITTRHRIGCFSLLALLLAPLLFLVAPLILAAVEVFGRLGAFMSSKLRTPEDGGPTDTPPENHL